MEKKFVVDYDKEEDIFRLFRNGSSVKFSMDIDLPLGDIVVDFDFQGRIVGLELFNASKYHPILENISENKIKAKMSVQYGRNWAFIFYEISAPGIKPISNSIVYPYNRKLAVEH